MASKKKEIIVRQVWAHNLHEEFHLIIKVIPQYSFAAIDTEFPGTIFRSAVKSKPPPYYNYQLMKANVDALNIIQIGLTLSDSQGNLPHLGTDFSYIWEFNFRDFDIERDPHSTDSTDLLKRQGINFKKNREEGIDSFEFSALVLSSGLVFNASSVTWVTFHSAYDFGYLIKVLTRQHLPHDLDSFVRLMVYFFGTKIYDLKHMICCFNGFRGGLESLAKILKVDRVVGTSHQAGSDSLLTLQVFMKLTENKLFDVGLPDFNWPRLYGLV